MNKTSFIKVLALTLSMFMMLTLLTACNGPSSSKAPSSSSENSSIDSTPSEESSSEVSSEVSSEDSSEDTTGNIPSEPAEEETIYELNLFNSKAPIINNYRGVSGSVHHASTYMHDANGRNYTEEMATIELNRLQDAGVRYCRTYFKTQWVWDGKTGSYNWNSQRINDFYRYAKEIQKRGMNLVLTVGWHFEKPIMTLPTKEIPAPWTLGICDSPYIYGHDSGGLLNRYGELDGYNYSAGLTADQKALGADEVKRLSDIGLRYGEFARQAVQECRKRGINNVTNILTFVEPSYRTPDAIKANKLEGLFAPQYITTVKALKWSFRKAGDMDNVKITGPNQGSVQDGDGLLKYVCKNAPTLFDVLTAHFYPTSSNITDDVFGDICDGVFGSYMGVVKNYKLDSKSTNNKKEFWVDEFYARSEGVNLGVPSAWGGIDTSVGILSAMKAGIQNISLWQTIDTLWIDQTNTGGEFINGIQVCGSVPSLLTSSIPKPQYYSVSLLGKYLGHQNGKVFPTYAEYGSGIYTGAVQLEDGNWTIVVINTNFESSKFRFTIDNSLNKNLYRHLYDGNNHVPTAKALLPQADKTYKDVKKVLTDTIPSASVVVYTSLKY